MLLCHVSDDWFNICISPGLFASDVVLPGFALNLSQHLHLGGVLLFRLCVVPNTHCSVIHVFKHFFFKFVILCLIVVRI